MKHYTKYHVDINPQTYGVRGAIRPPVIFLPLLKKSSGNPYPIILYFSQLFVTYAPLNSRFAKTHNNEKTIYIWPSVIVIFLSPKNVLTNSSCRLF